MKQAVQWIRNSLALTGVLALGFWFGASHTVKASSYESGDGVHFQLTGINPDSSLLVYEPGTKTVYVYQAATTGNSALQCSYKFQLTRPGEVIRRVPCAVPNHMP
jgi:hypothetical protein